MSLSLQICFAFVSEYKTYRMESLWNSLFHQISAKCTEFYTERKKECEDLIRDLNAAATLNDKIEIIDKVGELARKAQELKNPEKWKIPIPTSFLNPFRKSNSLWSETLHAVRTCLVYDILHSSERDKFLETIASLKKDREACINEIEKNLDKGNTPSLLEQEQKIYYKLLDRQDWVTIKNAYINRRFPVALTSKEDLQLPNEISSTLCEAIPIVYQKDSNYFTFFFLGVLHVKSGREVQFNELLKKYQELSKQARQISLLDEGFFNSPDVKEFLKTNSTNFKPDSPNETPSLITEIANLNTIENKEVSVTTAGLYKPCKDNQSEHASTPSTKPSTPKMNG